MSDNTGVAELLVEVRRGHEPSFNELCEILYGELRVLASRHRRSWGGDFTLQTTALVHEAFLKLAGAAEPDWKDRAHFFAVASRAMRQILVNYAERRRAQKRGGGAPHLSLDEANPVSPSAVEEILVLHEALDRLEAVHQRQARVVEHRFFSGLRMHETAEVLGVSVRTVERDWAAASAWLKREIRETLGSGGGRAREDPTLDGVDPP
jgi:RNA polymerase sigma-70 factor, ECF subfamily